MNLDEARRLDLIDQQQEMLDRLFMLNRGLTNYVLVTQRERAQLLRDLDNVQAWSTDAQAEFDRLRAEVQHIADTLAHPQRGAMPTAAD